MNNLGNNTTFLTLAIASLGAVLPAIQAQDFYTAGALFIFGLAMVFVYEKTPPTTPIV
jgi:hypothetical protein